MNNDVIFKDLLHLRPLLRAFFELFLPDVAAFVDFDQLEFVDKERATADARRRTGDLLIKTRFREQPAAFLIHIEHQAQPDPRLPFRLLEYFLLDGRDFGLPVYPIAVLSHRRPAPASSPLQVDFPNKRVLHFDFDVIDLARLDAREFASRLNPAGLAMCARMRLEPCDRVSVARDVLAALARSEIGEEERRAVTGFFFAYQPLAPEQELQLERELAKLHPEAIRERIMEWTNPWIDRGFRKGMEEGLLRGEERGLEQGLERGRQQEIELVLRQLARRVGRLTRAQQSGVRKLALPEVEALAVALLDFRSPADLRTWLANHA